MSGVCFCLRRGGFGWSFKPTTRMIWACSPTHLERARKMKGPYMQGDEDFTEMQARAAAIQAVAEYLQSLGSTDLAELESGQCDMLVRTVVEAYRAALEKTCEPF